VEGSRTPLPLQTRSLETWPDGSIRWLLVDFQATLTAPTRLMLSAGSDGPSYRERVTIDRNGDEYCVRTGAATFNLRSGFWFDRVAVDDVAVTDAARSGLEVLIGPDTTCKLRVVEIAIQESGPLRGVVAVRGYAEHNNEVIVELTVRLHFYAGSATVRSDMTVRNPRRASHPGGFWDLGDSASIYLHDVTLTLAVTGDASRPRLWCSAESGAPLETFELPFTLYQDSSGGANWQSSNHVNRHGDVPLRFRGYRIDALDCQRHGLRATPIVQLASSTASVAVAVPHFWQNFPKAIHAADNVLALRLFPRNFADMHELQGGEQKTHTFYVAFGSDEVTAVPLDWCRTPTFARLEPQWYRDCRAIPFLSVRADSGGDASEQLVDAAIEGESTFIGKREVIDEYGWRHFGDVYGDHEAVRRQGSPPLVSHYNNQYDAILGFAAQLFRSGDRRWWELMQDLAAHVVDIDIYHTTRDKWAYNGGLFWHTDHYVDAATATHRTFARSTSPIGGGPGPDHNYTTGLMLHHLMTGDCASRGAVIGLARWVVDMDDGRKTIFRWLSGAQTGLPTAFTPLGDAGPSRSSGNSLNALLDGHRLAREAGFLAKAEELIRRSVHPREDVAERNLLDVERKWSYTIFLQALGKYLEFKTDLGQLDAMYAYARESLLQYARWMDAHERPYLEKPELLEFPTETWAAQEIRKSEVLHLAALHASAAERTRFRERAIVFHRASIDTLLTMPTRKLTRPVVIMLTSAFKHQFFVNDPDCSAPPPLETCVVAGRHTAFVPQKVVAKRVGALLAAAVAGLTIAAMIAMGWG
jgi:hypothetical protein